MSFKVSVRSGNGHDEPEEPEAEIIEFATEAEQVAFIRGVNLTVEVMDGWVNSWVLAKEITTINVSKEDNRG